VNIRLSEGEAFLRKRGSNLPFAAKGRFDPLFQNKYDEAKRQREAP
jgi:hypothetical protein